MMQIVMYSHTCTWSCNTQ